MNTEETKKPPEIKVEDLSRYRESGHLTVGKLKEAIANMPDDGLVLVQRIEDMYFEENNWGVVLKEGEHYHWGLEFNKGILEGKYNDKEQYPNANKENLRLFTEEELNKAKDQYHPAWCSVKYKDDPNNLYLDLHY
jgi:hypothetical protein